MPTTHTGSAVANADLRAIHAGDFTITKSHHQASVSASDEIFLMPLPVGMIVTDIKVQIAEVGGTISTWKVGDVDDDDRYMSSLTASATALYQDGINTTAGRGYRVSISDDASPYYSILRVKKCAGTTTGTVSILVSITGHMEPA